VKLINDNYLLIIKKLVDMGFLNGLETGVGDLEPGDANWARSSAMKTMMAGNECRSGEVRSGAAKIKGKTRGIVHEREDLR
jgi:hypothetical protein